MRDGAGRRVGVRARAGGFARRRVADVLLAVCWLVVLINLSQLVQVDAQGTTRTVLSYAALIALGLAATYYWWRTRRRSR